MKKLVYLFATLFIVAIATENVKAQSSATVNDASAGATIIAPIELNNDLSLEFGKIVKSSDGGNVIVSASDAPTRTPDGGLTFINSDVWRPAKFTVNGDDDQSFSITKPATVKLNGPSSSEMTITTSISGNTTGVTTSSGSYVFYVGGTLAVASDQTIGDYTGTYEVTVQYE